MSKIKKYRGKIGKRRPSAGLSAIAAVALNLEGVGSPVEVTFPAELVLDRFQFWRKNLDHRAAPYAYEVIVMLMPEGMLIVGVPVVLFNFCDKAAFDEEGKGSVNGSLGDLDFLIPHIFEEFFRGKVAEQGRDLIEDPLSLLRELKPFFIEEFPEYLSFHTRILMEMKGRIQI